MANETTNTATAPADTDTATPESAGPAVPNGGESPPADSQGGAAEDTPAAPEADAQEKVEEAEEIASYSADNVLRAGQLGLSKDDIAKHGNDEALGATLDVLERKAAAERTQRREQQQQQTEQARVKAPEPFKLELDEELIDPSLSKPLHALNQHYHERMMGLQQQLHVVIGALQRQDLDMFRDRFGKAVEGLGEEFADAKKDEKFQERIMDMMDVLVETHKRNHRSLPPLPELVQQAARIAHGEKAATHARKQIVATLARKKGQLLTKPTARAAPAPKTDLEKGEAAAAAWHQQHGSGATY